MGFTAGQQAYSDFFELTLENGRITELQDEAVERGMACHRISEGRLNICYVICTQYNYWEGCTSHPGRALFPFVSPLTQACKTSSWILIQAGGAPTYAHRT